MEEPMESQIALAEEVDSAEMAEVDFVSQIRPRVSSIVKAPTPVSPNPQHTGTDNHLAARSISLINFVLCRHVCRSRGKSR
jgi:hypothetical protein